VGSESVEGAGGRHAATARYPAAAAGVGRAASLMRIAYLASRYPAVSHTFIQREIAGLRDEGVTIDTFAIRRAQPDEVLSRADEAEARATYALLPVRLTHLVRAHVRALVRHPRRYKDTLREALRLAPPGARGALWQIFYFGESVLLWDRCRRRGATHVHAHFANVASDVALLAARLGRGAGEGPRSWSLTMHGSTEFYDVPRYRLAEKARQAEFVACVSDFTRSQMMLFLEEEHWPKLALVRCGVDPERFAPRDGDRGGPLRILTVGRLVGGKGFALLVDAVHALVERGHDVALTVVGDGPSAGHLHARARRLGLADSVEWVGALGQDEIRERYASADVFCLPSFAEGVPVVLMEAMAMEVPVVATRLAGIPELIEDGTSGLLVTPARADELADALGRLAGDPELRARLGAAGRRAVLDGYDLGRWTGALRGLLETAAGHST
jgi:glycosyltransferase involved in cell wall biosynthesis